MKKVSTKTRNIIISSVVCTVAMTAGVGLGIFFGKGLFTTVSVKEPNDWLKYEDDTKSLLNKYNRANGDYSKGFKNYELANLAIYLYEQTTNHYSVLKGEATATMGVKQAINTTSIRNGDDFFWESLSHSKFVEAAVRFYENKNEDFITSYSGEITNGHTCTEASWNTGSKEKSEKDVFENKWGKTLDVSNIYTISQSTILNPDQKITTDENGNYFVHLELDPIKANRRYIRQMITMSNLSSDPVYETLSIDYTLEPTTLKIVNKYVHEKYQVVAMGMTATSDTEMNETFYYDEEYKIPDLNTNCNYGGK